MTLTTPTDQHRGAQWDGIQPAAVPEGHIHHREDTDMTTTTKITRQQAAALLLLTSTYRNALDGCALRVTGPRTARWEATNGNALLLLPWGVGDDEPHGLEPGVYLVARRDLLRRAKMPVALWDADVDGNVPLTLDSADKPQWPDTPKVIPGEDGEAFGEPAAVHGMRTNMLETPAKVARAMFGPRGASRICWRIERGEALSPQHFRGKHDDTTIDLYMMPARID